MKKVRADLAAERHAREVAASALERMGDRPGDDEPARQAEYDALVAAVEGVDDAVDLKLAFLPLTDLGNAERFAKRNRDRFLYVAALGWLAWDGRRWARDGAEESVERSVHDTVRAIQREASALRSSDRDITIEEKKQGDPVMLSDKLAGWGRMSESATKMAAIPKHASPYLTMQAGELDKDPWKINVLNGTIHVNPNGEDDGDPISFLAHNPADLITKLAPVSFLPDAKCPIYDRFLRDVQPESEMQRFLHQWGGYSLTGDTSLQKLCFFYGKGKNGKSTLVDAWGVVSGDYGETVPIETFLDQGRGRNAGAATPDLALLPGVRFLRTSEPEKGAKLAEALIKLVTGGEPIQARHLNRDYFKFRPAFKLTMSGNYRPSIAGTDEGIWRRVVLVPWQVTVEKPDVSLPAKLMREAPGILNRLLDGLRDYLDGGLTPPELVTEATQSYRDDSDPLGRFISLALETVEGSREQSTVVYRTFIAWAKAIGEREWTAKGFSMAMKERGYRSIQSNLMWWRNVRLKMREADFDPARSPHPDEEGAGDE